MNLHSLRRTLPLAALLTSLAPAAFAHGVWVESQHGDLAIVYGHGPEQDSYDLAKITSAQVCPGGESCAAATLTEHANHATLPVPDTASAIAIEFDNRFWSKDADGEWHNLPKDAVEGAVSGGHYLKHGVHLTGSIGTIGTPFGQALEIVPAADPYALKAGDGLPVQVLYNGEPLPEAEIIVDYVNASGAEPIVADAEGKATVPVRNQGLNVIAVGHTSPHPDPAKADDVGHLATLSFTLGY